MASTVTVAAARACFVNCAANAAGLRRRSAVTLAAAAAAQAVATATAAGGGKQPVEGTIILESHMSDVEIPNETVPQYLLRKSQNLSHHPCITCGVGKRTLSFADVRALTRRWALALVGRLALHQGDVVGLLLPNVPEYVPTLQGALLAGLKVTMANPNYTAVELRRQFLDAGAHVIVTVGSLAEKAKASVPAGTPVIVLQAATASGDSVPKDALIWEKLLEEGVESDAANFPPPDPDAVAALPYSSGTTGLPKGVMLTHRNLVSNLEMIDHPEMRHAFPTTDIRVLLANASRPNQSNSSISVEGNTWQDVALTVLPFFHIYGFNGVLNLGLMQGMHTISMPMFTPEDYIRCLEEYKPTTLYVVPSLMQFLAVHPKVTSDMLSSLRTVVSGAAPATRALMDKFREKVGRDDIHIRQGYGMTECSPVALMAPPKVSRSKETSVGRLVPNTRCRVVRPDGKDAGPGERGELLLSGEQVMKGYLGNEKATRETVDEEGWLHTGDVVYYDEEQFFYIVDRTKELIKVKGNQVSPTELENLVMELPEVADCAVVGIPDPRTDEAPRAFVVLKPNTKLTAEQIHKHIEPKVIKYKQLTGGIIFLDKIPRNPSGKILRQELKDWKQK